MLVLVTGGARSGKSRFAESYATELGTSGIYVATSEIHDDEMKLRVYRHQERRKQAKLPWTTIEEPLDLARIIYTIAAKAPSEAGLEQANKPCPSTVVVIDCLTLWLSNLIVSTEGEDVEGFVQGKVTALIEAAQSAPFPIIIVTNEVGDGIVPAYPLGRLFRDIAGGVNQRMAGASNQVFLVTTGIPVELKSRAFRLRGEGDALESGQG